MDGRLRYCIFGTTIDSSSGVKKIKVASNAKTITPKLDAITIHKLIPIRLIKSRSRIQIRLVKATEKSTRPIQRAKAGSASSPNRMGARLLAVLCKKLIPKASASENLSNKTQVLRPRRSQLIAPSKKIIIAVSGRSFRKAANTLVKSKRLDDIQIVAPKIRAPMLNFKGIDLTLLFSLKGTIGISNYDYIVNSE